MNRFFGQQTLNGEWHALLPRYILVSERVTGRRILDIGCGSGIGASLLHEMGATHVNAIDHRPAVLNVAQSRSEKEGLTFEVMFWEDLHFEDDSFDLVLCLDPASPVTDPSLLLEVRRVLRPGGEYICAIERRMVSGLEELLPRYGYPNSAEHVDMYKKDECVPQLGEVKRYFPYVESLIQRPRLSYTFCNDHSDDLDRTLDIDARFCDPNDDPGAVEIWFCGDQPIKDMPEKVVQMPYTEIVTRLSEVANHVHIHSVVDRIDGHASTVDELFDEIVEDPSLSLNAYGGCFEEATLASDLHATSFRQGSLDFPKHSPYIESEFDTIRAVDGKFKHDNFHSDNDFEERINTNAFFDPVNNRATTARVTSDDLKEELEAELAAVRAAKDMEIQHLKEMFDNLTSVVERQSEMIQALLQKESDASLQDPALQAQIQALQSVHLQVPTPAPVDDYDNSETIEKVRTEPPAEEVPQETNPTDSQPTPEPTVEPEQSIVGADSEE